MINTHGVNNIARAAAPTEIFLPQLHYPRGARVEVSDGVYEMRAAEQRLIYKHDAARDVHRVHVRPA